MKITLETKNEAIAAAAALVDWIRTGLELAGYLAKIKGEDPYYTTQRDLLQALKDFLK